MRDGSAEAQKRGGGRKGRPGQGSNYGRDAGVKTDRGRGKKCEGRKELSDNAEGSAEL